MQLSPKLWRNIFWSGEFAGVWSWNAPPPDRELIALFNRELDAFIADYHRQHISIKNS